jgi:hypothetical protein
METMQVFDLRCSACSWKQSHIVTAEYARTLKVQHEYRYDKHTVETTNG